MPVDVFPEFAPPRVVVQTEAPGLSSEDVEALIIFPIESAVNGTPGVDTVRSSAREPTSILYASLQQIDVPQVVVKYDREKATRYGLNIGDLAEITETSLNGTAVSQVLEGQRTFDLFIRLSKESRKIISRL